MKYNPSLIEKKWQKKWHDLGIFKAKIDYVALAGPILKGEYKENDIDPKLDEYEEMNKETKPPPADEIWHLDGELDYYNCYDSLWHIRMKNVKCTKGGEEVVPELKTLSVLATDVNRNKKPKLSW